VKSTVEHEPSLLLGSRSSTGLLLAVLGSNVMRRLRETHTALELKPRQFEILGLLDELGPVGQAELAAEMGLAASALVVLLNPLEAAGRVQRYRDPANRKRNLVDITARGRAVLAKAARAQRDIDKQLMATLTMKQRDQFAGLLKRIRDSVAAYDDAETPGWVGSAIRSTES
jgi:DNA-binding MarR family transcriptional regulator